jgi:hypothetical protein
MSIARLEQWLKDEGGYEYHCFVSYPRIKKPDGTIDDRHPINECAQQVRDALIRHLGSSFNQPRVFLDTGMGGGADWEKTLRGALCRSLVMVAICADIYYHPAHAWCGLEWAAMDALRARRIPDSDLRTIVPLMIKKVSDVSLLPPAVRVPQWRDVSGGAVSRRYYTTKAFQECILDVVAHIEKVAGLIAEGGVLSGCTKFDFPQTSAFADWRPAPAAFPFQGGR